MSSLPDKTIFSAAQPCSNIEPQKIENYVKPSKRNGWLVAGHPPTADRTPQLKLDPHKYRDWSPDREVRRSIVDPRHDVTLPAMKFLRGKL